MGKVNRGKIRVLACSEESSAAVWRRQSAIGKQDRHFIEKCSDRLSVADCVVESHPEEPCALFPRFDKTDTPERGAAHRQGFALTLPDAGQCGGSVGHRREFHGNLQFRRDPASQLARLIFLEEGPQSLMAGHKR